MVWTDKRIKLLTELLGNMRLIKVFAWEVRLPRPTFPLFPFSLCAVLLFLLPQLYVVDLSMPGSPSFIFFSRSTLVWTL